MTLQQFRQFKLFGSLAPAWLSYNSLGGRVSRVLFGVASLTTAACAVSLFSFAVVTDSLDGIEKRGFPVSAQAFSLARQAAEYSSIASALLAVTDTAELNFAKGRLTTKFRELSTTLDTLKALKPASDTRFDINQLKAEILQLNATIAGAVTTITGRLNSAAKSRQFMNKAGVMHRRIAEDLAPVIDDTGFDLAMALEKMAGGVAPGAAGAGSEFPLRELHARLDMLLSIRSESNNLIALYNEVSLVTNAEVLPPLRDQIAASALRAANSGGAIAMPGRSSDTQLILDKVVEFGESGETVLKNREAELAAILKGAQSVKKILGLTGGISDDIQRLVISAKSATEADIEDTRRAVHRSKIILFLLAAASLIATLTFTWTLIGKGLVRPLTRMNEAIRELAAGNLNVEIPHDGDQELRNMSAAIEIFKLNAILANELEIEKEHARLVDLRQREASFRLMFDGNPLPMCLIEEETGAFVSVNEAAVQHYGYDREKFLRLTMSDLYSSRPADLEVQTHIELLSQAGKETTAEHIKSDGQLISVAIYSQKLSFKKRRCILIAVIDTTERNRVQKTISHLAHHDGLTGLVNRAQFKLTLDEAVKNGGQNVAALFLDLDRFKNVNDTLGHSAGDQLLKCVGQRLKNCVRRSDTIARLGGDEFAVIAFDMDKPASAEALSKRIIKAIEMPFEIDGHHIHVGTSIGIAIAPGAGTDSEELLKNADLALYRAKHSGRGTYRFFEAGMDAQLQARSSLERDLRVAVSNQELQLHYQPIVKLITNEIVGFEALIRWHHAERGWVSPGDFVPLAEEVGLISQIGSRVLRQACIEAASWPSSASVSVNLSAVQIHSTNVYEAVESALKASGLAPNRLELEITESVFLHNSKSNLSALHRLRDLGVRIALDDFGTGYSSLGYLQNFPFDKLKIDRLFIKDLAAGEKSVTLLQAIVTLANGLDMTTTAEGVETEQQLALVKAVGCNEMQGWLFSKAVAADELRSFFKPKPGTAKTGNKRHLSAA